jgi:Domain of unknown function (DUF3943)
MVALANDSTMTYGFKTAYLQVPSLIRQALRRRVEAMVRPIVRNKTSIAVVAALAVWSAPLCGQETVQRMNTVETRALFSSSFPDSLASAATARQDTATFCCRNRIFPVAAGELLALLVIPHYFNRYVADDTTAALSWNSWSHNLRTGFQWDNNAFVTNMFMHPFHGNTYFNAGRSNGYNYWGAAGFSMAGALMWELFGENNRPAINDWIMTGVGGIAVGETLHRTATMIRDNTARGAGRSFRELGAFLIDPVGGFSRAVRGEMSKVGANPDGRIPDTHGIQMTAGFRNVDAGRLTDTQESIGYLDLLLVYDNPYTDFSVPFESFEFEVQWNRRDKVPIGRIGIQGTLWGTTLKRTDTVEHSFTINQIFDYIENNAFEIGGPSFGFTFNSSFTVSDRVRIDTRLQPTLNLLTGINSEYGEFSQQQYDFGSGAGLRLRGTLLLDRIARLRFAYAGLYRHTLNGAAGNQVAHFSSIQGRWPIWRSVGAGVDYVVYVRNSFYRDFPDVHRVIDELRVAATFTWR